jgi:glycosyltransferase involved in cell wall biosynthesis
VFKDFSAWFAAWFGCDVALATGWETVYPVLALDHCRARVYLIQDHEPEFFPTSAERLWAERTYAADLHPIAASSWLARLVEERVGAPVSRFDFGVDHDVYRPLDVERRDDTVIFYCRTVTPRRGAPLGLLALAELHRRRPKSRFVLYGDPLPAKAPFPCMHLGIATPVQLARAYAEATVGLSLSLTNHSLVPQEMLACGLPCVEVAGGAFDGLHGDAEPLLLVHPDPVELADALERLLDDPAERERRARGGIEAVRGRTWERASVQVEQALRKALRLREDAAGFVA